MAQFTVTQIEDKVKALNEKMMHFEAQKHPKYYQWEANRNFYVSKLTEMDEYDLKTIEI